jgi:hypothetical protein
MQHLAGSGTPVLYIGRTILNGYRNAGFGSEWDTLYYDARLHERPVYTYRLMASMTEISWMNDTWRNWATPVQLLCPDLSCIPMSLRRHWRKAIQTSHQVSRPRFESAIPRIQLCLAWPLDRCEQQPYLSNWWSFADTFLTYYSLYAFVCLSLEEAEAVGIRRVRPFNSRLASVIHPPHLLHCVWPLNSQFGCNKVCGCGWYLPAINQSLLPSSLTTLDSSTDCT